MRACVPPAGTPGRRGREGQVREGAGKAAVARREKVQNQATVFFGGGGAHPPGGGE